MNVCAARSGNLVKPPINAGRPWKRSRRGSACAITGATHAQTQDICHTAVSQLEKMTQQTGPSWNSVGGGIESLRHQAHRTGSVVSRFQAARIG
jgi:hypothetical protein